MFEQLKYNMKHNRKSVMRAATAWFIFGAIILVFVFWGLTPQQQGVAEGGSAVSVNGKNISLAQYADVVERMRRDPQYEQLSQLGGDAGRQILQQQALNQLVEMELIRQETENQRLWTSDAEVRDIIVSIPAFQENGQFKRELYRAYLEGSRKSPAEFEDEIRRDQSLRRTVRLFGSALRPLSIEGEHLKKVAAMKANLEFAAVPTETLVIPESIKEPEIKEFLAKEGSEAKVKEYFDSHKAEFSTPEQVKARHILIRATAGDAEAEKNALAKVEELEKKARAGEDFAKLATANSEDPGSKTKGGLLDFFGRGKMVPEFEEAAFAMKAGEISKPVKTNYGYHLIQLVEKRPAKDRTLDEVRNEIASNLIAREKSKVQLDQLKELMSKGDVAAVNKFVADHKLNWEETGAFSVDSENIPKIGPNDEIMQTAFKLTPEKPLAPTLVREGASAYIVRYKAVPAAKPGSEDKPDMMAEMMASRRGQDALRQWVSGMQKQAKIATNPTLSQR